MAVHYVHSGVVETVENWKAHTLCKCIAATRLPLIVLGEYGRPVFPNCTTSHKKQHLFFPPSFFFF